jgi:guanylate kinase
MPRGILFILSGPSGAGKGTLRRMLFEELPGLAYSVSCTTRAPRRGERDGTDYRFVDEATFDRLVRENRFAEYAEVHGHRYGTLLEDLEDLLERGLDVMLEIDVRGAEQVKAKMPEAFTIFILPPSVKVLEDRLSGRGTETPEERALRLRNAAEEMVHAAEFDRAIVNDDVSRAGRDMIALVEERRRTAGGPRIKGSTEEDAP